MLDQIKAEFSASIAVKQSILEDAELLTQIEEVATACLEALKDGGKVIFCGNGGSFADSQHLSAEFTSRFLFDRAPLPSLALGTNSSAMSAIGNDYGYDEVFSRELACIANDKDVFIPISTSGNSPNVMKAVDVANQKGVKTYVLTGETGGKLKAMANCLCIPSKDTARIQESHIVIGHLICGLVEERYFK